MIEVQYKIQVTNLVTILYQLFISRVVSSFSSEFAMILSFFRVTEMGQKTVLYKKVRRFVILGLKFPRYRGRHFT